MGYGEAPWEFRGRALYQLSLVRVEEVRGMALRVGRAAQFGRRHRRCLHPRLPAPSASNSTCSPC